MKAESVPSHTGARSRSGHSWLVAIGIVAFGVSLGLAQKANRTAQEHARPMYGPLAEAPEGARGRKNPFAGDLQEVTAGGKLFEQHCAECHGEKAGGTRRAPSLLRPEVQQAPPGALFWVLTNGVVRRGMPVWSKLPEPQRWQIVTFVQSLNANRIKAARD